MLNCKEKKKRYQKIPHKYVLIGFSLKASIKQERNRSQFFWTYFNNSDQQYLVVLPSQAIEYNWWKLIRGAS